MNIIFKRAMLLVVFFAQQNITPLMSKTFKDIHPIYYHKATFPRRTRFRRTKNSKAVGARGCKLALPSPCMYVWGPSCKTRFRGSLMSPEHPKAPLEGNSLPRWWWFRIRESASPKCTKKIMRFRKYRRICRCIMDSFLSCPGSLFLCFQLVFHSQSWGKDS